MEGVTDFSYLEGHGETLVVHLNWPESFQPLYTQDHLTGYCGQDIIIRCDGNSLNGEGEPLTLACTLDFFSIGDHHLKFLVPCDV